MGLAVIAGSGALPRLLLDQTKAILVQIENVKHDIDSPAQITAQFERLGGLFSDLHAAGVTEVCLAGAMGRPALDMAKLDAVTTQMLPRLLPLLGQGDDALLRGVIAEFEANGFLVRGPHQLVPDLLVPQGCLTDAQPSAQDRADAARARSVLDALGPLDVGQGCVTCAGQVLGIETLYGTDAMLAAVAAARATRQPIVNGVFVKRAKPGQDLRVDLPTIGPDTIEAVLAADLSAIALQADHVQILDKAQVLAQANAAGLAIWAEA